MFDVINERSGGLDICINNAGMAYNESITEGNPDRWRQIFDVSKLLPCCIHSYSYNMMIIIVIIIIIIIIIIITNIVIILLIIIIIIISGVSWLFRFFTSAIVCAVACVVVFPILYKSRSMSAMTSLSTMG